MKKVYIPGSVVQEFDENGELNNMWFEEEGNFQDEDYIPFKLEVYIEE